MFIKFAHCCGKQNTYISDIEGTWVRAKGRDGIGTGDDQGAGDHSPIWKTMCDL